MLGYEGIFFFLLPFFFLGLHEGLELAGTQRTHTADPNQPTYNQGEFT